MLREITKAVLATLRDTLRSRAALVAENTLLRQQVIVFHRAAPHPRLKPRDRFTISAITKLFPSLVAAVPIVRPATVIRWHRDRKGLVLAFLMRFKQICNSAIPVGDDGRRCADGRPCPRRVVVTW